MRSYVPERFREAVLLHVARNLGGLARLRPPLLMGIHGPSGDGKTYQTSIVLDEAGIETFRIAGGQLESWNAGEPAHLIREVYDVASDELSRGKLAALIIDDIDAGVGDWGPMVQYTTNRQGVIVTLMNLADTVHRSDTPNKSRVPIFLTGNDFQKLYGPLVRAGRMHAFEWRATNKEKIAIVNEILPACTYEYVRMLVDSFPDQPIAFFRYLSSRLLDNVLIEDLRASGATAFLRRWTDVNSAVDAPLSSVPFKTLEAIGAQIAAEGRFENHLDDNRESAAAEGSVGEHDDGPTKWARIKDLQRSVRDVMLITTGIDDGTLHRVFDAGIAAYKLEWIVIYAESDDGIRTARLDMTIDWDSQGLRATATNATKPRNGLNGRAVFDFDPDAHGRNGSGLWLHQIASDFAAFVQRAELRTTWAVHYGDGSHEAGDDHE